MRIHEIITLIEAAYDSTIAAMKKRYPDQIANIDQIVKWAKTILKRQDRIAWYLRIADAYYSGNKQKLQTLVGRYEFTDLQKLATDIEHFMVYPVDSYQFVVQPVDKVIDDLSEIEKKHKEKTTKNAPVSIQPGDKELISFPGGFCLVVCLTELIVQKKVVAAVTVVMSPANKRLIKESCPLEKMAVY